jgi:hypothetical protein
MDPKVHYLAHKSSPFPYSEPDESNPHHAVLFPEDTLPSLYSNVLQYCRALVFAGRSWKSWDTIGLFSSRLPMRERMGFVGSSVQIM